MAQQRPIRIGLSGFGRIGRLALRAQYETGIKDVEIVAVNDWKNLEHSAHLLEYDSVHGRFNTPITIHDDKDAKGMDLGQGLIHALSDRDPARLDWQRHQVDIVFECTGKFNKREAAAAHLSAGAKGVLVSAPCTEADKTIVYGVNHDMLTAQDRVVSNASCTTNCLAPVIKVLDQSFGVEKGFCTTIHAMTGDQNLVDSSHKDLRRARAASLSMIPTSTGAARSLGLVLPQLKGRFDGSAVRVPTANVSMIDLHVQMKQNVSVEQVNAAMQQASHGALKNVLGYSDAPLVSIDFNHNPNSSIFDASQTQIIGQDFLRVVSWYDNEWGFALRMFDVAREMMKTYS